MDCKEVVTGIIVPIVSAIIGGLLTMWGVIHTIRHENKCRKEDEHKLYKPLFMSIPVYDDRVDRNTIVVNLESDEDKGMYSLLQGYIKNLDFSHFIIDKVVVNDTAYSPYANSVIEKNSAISIGVYGSQQEVNTAALYISDVLGNKYVYNIIFEYNQESGYRIIKDYVLIKGVSK